MRRREIRLRFTLVILALSASFAIAEGVPAAASTPQAADAYPAFAKFCSDNFGTAHEDLTFQLPGRDLKILDDGTWKWISQQSASLAWETNLPAIAYVEYGTTDAYGKKTEPSARANYLHLIRLTGLATGATYHYRLVATDESGKRITSPDAMFSCARPEGKVVEVSTDAAMPIVCDQAGTTYLLRGDMSAPGVGISVVAPNVTIDLDGHTLTYNQQPAKGDGSIGREFGQLASQGVQGVRCSYAARSSTKLFNGTIKQGAGAGGYGCVPVQFRGTEIAGVTLEYYGTQISGIDGECKQVHHNVILDHGIELTNRHQGVQGIGVTGDVQHNRIDRVRQRGISAASGSKIDHNEIYVDSCATNSFGIMFYKSRNCEAIGNRIFGTGYLAIGIGTVSEGVGDIKIAKNFIQMQAREPDTRWTEYGDQSGAYCVRMTWGGENIEYADNVLVSKGRDGGMVRCVWFCPNPKMNNVAFRRNTMKAICENDQSSKWGAVVVCGENDPKDVVGLFEENTVISNFCNVRLGEEYGAGRNARFVGNTFVREGNLSSYATVICGFWTPDNDGNVFLNSKVEGGADLANAKWDGTGNNSYAIGKIEGGADVIEKTLKGNGAAAN
jgi:hypothetical protein